MPAKSASPAGLQILEEIGFADLPKEWDIIRVEDLLCDDRGISVGVMYPGHHDPEGIPLIKAGDLTDNRITAQPEFRITIDKHHEYRRTELAGGELLISLVGDVGRCALVQPQMAGWNAARAVAVLRFVSQTDAAFVRFCLMSSPLQHLMQSWATTTVQATLNLKEIRQIPLPWPPKEQRDVITHILGTLDDKIELNRRMNETLEAIAQAIFKSWFVDFDPVRAKAEGRDPGLPKHLADLFPDRLEDSELGEIPTGWKTRPVGSVIDRLPVGKKYEQKTVNPSGKIPVLDQGKSGIIGYHNDQAGIDASASCPVIVFANHTCYMRLVHFPFSAIQNVLPFVGKGINTTWIFFATYGKQTFSEYKGHWPDFVRMEIVVPAQELTDEFSRTVYPLLKKIWSQEAESITFAALRDALLPKLISGELCVNDAEQFLQRMSV